MMYSDVVMLNEQHVFIHRRDTRFVPTTNTCFLLYYIFFFIQYNILYKEEQNIRERNRENYLIHRNICIRILSRVCVCDLRGSVGFSLRFPFTAVVIIKSCRALPPQRARIRFSRTPSL